MIRSGLGEPAATPTPGPAPAFEGQEVPLELAEDAVSVAGRLTKLDDALAAIESATDALERTYAEELAQRGDETAEDETPRTPSG